MGALGWGSTGTGEGPVVWRRRGCALVARAWPGRACAGTSSSLRPIAWAAAAEAPSALGLAKDPARKADGHDQQYDAVAARGDALAHEHEILLDLRLNDLPDGNGGNGARYAGEEAVPLHAHARKVDEAAARGVWRYDEDVVVAGGQAAARRRRRRGMAASGRLGVGTMRRRRGRRAVHGCVCPRGREGELRQAGSRGGGRGSVTTGGGSVWRCAEVLSGVGGNASAE
jgi:hypothetical protein